MIINPVPEIPQEITEIEGGKGGVFLREMKRVSMDLEKGEIWELGVGINAERKEERSCGDKGEAKRVQQDLP